MNVLEKNIIPTFSGDDLLFDIFSELLGPLVIIRRDRRIVFKSRSFEEVLGIPITSERLECKILILPNAGGCCIDAIDAYPVGVQSGIWNLNRPDGRIVSVLAHWRPINVGPTMSLLAIQFDRMQDSASVVASSFFVALRRSSGDEPSYWQRVFDYLEKTVGFGKIALVETALGTTKLHHARGLSAADCEQIITTMVETGCRTQDILVNVSKETEVVHAISVATSEGAKSLVIGQLADNLNTDFLDIALASLSASTGSVMAVSSDFERDIDMQSLLGSLSPAEADVLQKIIEGMSDKDIALSRQVSPYTVKNQVKAILKKTAATRRTDLIRRFARISG